MIRMQMDHEVAGNKNANPKRSRCHLTRIALSVALCCDNAPSHRILSADLFGRTRTDLGAVSLIHKSKKEQKPPQQNRSLTLSTKKCVFFQFETRPHQRRVVNSWILWRLATPKSVFMNSNPKQDTDEPVHS